MNGVMGIHIAAGFIALVTGAMAVAVRKGGPEHASAPSELGFESEV